MRLTARRLLCAFTALPKVVHASLDEQTALIAGFQKRVDECNQPGKPSVPFWVGNQLAGHVSTDFAPALAQHPGVFEVSDDAVRLADALLDLSVEERTAAVATATSALRDAGLVKGWRDELLAVSPAFDAPPLLLLERALVPLFGVRGYGVHINGWCIEPTTGEPHLWVARRAANKPTWPGMLDHMVAGAQPAGLSPSANVIKEAGEEAGVPPELAMQAQAVGVVNYEGVDEEGELRRDTLFCCEPRSAARTLHEHPNHPIAAHLVLESSCGQTTCCCRGTLSRRPSTARSSRLSAGRMLGSPRPSRISGPRHTSPIAISSSSIISCGVGTSRPMRRATSSCWRVCAHPSADEETRPRRPRDIRSSVNYYTLSRRYGLVFCVLVLDQTVPRTNQSNSKSSQKSFRSFLSLVARVRRRHAQQSRQGYFEYCTVLRAVCRV